MIIVLTGVSLGANKLDEQDSPTEGNKPSWAVIVPFFFFSWDNTVIVPFTLIFLTALSLFYLSH